MSPTIAVSLFLILALVSSVNCWIINNINYPELKRQLTMEFGDYDNEVSSDELARGFTLIYPGTKWCGAGNTAENYDDLGSERETDICCREHDFCPDIIEAGQAKHNLTNDAFYTRLSCDCDEKFRQCLRATKKRTASNIGTVYFNLLGTKCFRNDYPAKQCVKRGGWLNRKCLEHAYNMNSTKRYQWFDVQEY